MKSISEHEFAGSIEDFLSISNAHLSDKQPIRWRHLLEGKSGHVGSKPSWSEIFSMVFRFFTAEKLYHANPQWPKQMGYSWPILRRTKGSPGSAAAKTQRGSWFPCVAINVVWDQGSSRKHLPWGPSIQLSTRPFWSFDPLWSPLTPVAPFDSKTETVVSLNKKKWQHDAAWTCGRLTDLSTNHCTGSSLLHTQDTRGSHAGMVWMGH